MHYSIWLHLGHMQQHSVCGKEFLLQSGAQQPHVEAPLAESTATFSPADSTAGWLAVQNPLLPKLGENCQHICRWTMTPKYGWDTLGPCKQDTSVHGLEIYCDMI